MPSNSDAATGPVRRTHNPNAPASTATGRRLELERLLSAHDPDTAQAATAAIRDADQPILRQMATESAATGTPPVLRRHAILVLAQRPTSENLSLLRRLAGEDSDLNIRGTATAALASTGRQDALAVVLSSMSASDPVLVAYAQCSARVLAEKLGRPAVDTAFAAASTDAKARLASAFNPASGNGTPNTGEVIA